MSQSGRYDIADYDEFGLLEYNAEHAGLPWDGAPPARRHTIDAGDGHGISAIVWGSVGSDALPGIDAPAPDLVFLHGHGQNAHTWDTVLQGLGRPAVAIDQPGHGHSDWREDRDYSLSRGADSVAAVLRELSTTPAFIVGMSMGGLTTMALAARHPDLVRGAVIIDITPGSPPRLGKLTAAQRGVEALTAGAEVFDSFEAMVDAAAAAAPGRTWDSLARGVAHNAKQASDGTWIWRYDRSRRRPAPSPVIGSGSPAAASASLFTHDDDVEEFVRRKPGTPVHVVDGSGHSVQSDRPRELVEIIRAAMG
jgi:esterase